MCGRYELHAHPDVVALQFGLDGPPQFKASYNICPGSDVLAVRVARNGQRIARAVRWGRANKLANARGESLTERPAFRDAFREWRCLVPASGFYEWQTRAGRKVPWYLRPLDAELFGLAGIAAFWNGLRSVSLITTQPNELMAPIHDRMPVIVPPESYAEWLDPGNRDTQALMRFVQPYPPERMAGYRVSTRVSKPENDDAALLEPVTEGSPQRELL
jgi:putative SOS response-associated peptidase YedK